MWNDSGVFIPDGNKVSFEMWALLYGNLNTQRGACGQATSFQVDRIGLLHFGAGEQIWLSAYYSCGAKRMGMPTAAASQRLFAAIRYFWHAVGCRCCCRQLSASSPVAAHCISETCWTRLLSWVLLFTAKVMSSVGVPSLQGAPG